MKPEIQALKSLFVVENVDGDEDFLRLSDQDDFELASDRRRSSSTSSVQASGERSASRLNCTFFYY